MDNSTRNPLAEVVASLEGMKVVAMRETCKLLEYNFDDNCWYEVDRSARPMSLSQAESWLQGWNDVDRHVALGLLTGAFAE